MSAIKAGRDAQSKEWDLWFFSTEIITEFALVEEIIKKYILEKGKR